MLLEAKNEGKADNAPALKDWTQEAAILADLVDAVRQLTDYTVAVNSKKGAGKRSDPYPRPRTALEKVRRQVRGEQHETLVSRMLPHKRAGNSPVRSSQ